jgi:hypothetical protein
VRAVVADLVKATDYKLYPSLLDAPTASRAPPAIEPVNFSLPQAELRESSPRLSRGGLLSEI